MEESQVVTSSSGSPAISVVVTTIPTNTSQTTCVDPTNSNTARHRLSKVKLVGVGGLERQNYCCGHWFPSSKSYHLHLAEKAVSDSIHEAKLLDLGMVRCAQCSVWVHTENIIAHLAKGHSNKEPKTQKMMQMGTLTEVPRVTGDSMLTGTNIVIKVTGQTTPKSFSSNLSKTSGNSLAKSGTVKLVTTSNSTLYQKVQNMKHTDANGTEKVIVRKSVTNSVPMVNVGPRLVMKSLGQGVSHLSRGHKVVQKVSQPGLSSVNGVTLATTFKAAKQSQSSTQGIAGKTPLKAVAPQSNLQNIAGRNVKFVKRITSETSKGKSVKYLTSNSQNNLGLTQTTKTKEKKVLKVLASRDASSSKNLTKKRRKQVLKPSPGDTSYTDTNTPDPPPPPPSETKPRKRGRKPKPSISDEGGNCTPLPNHKGQRKKLKETFDYDTSTPKVAKRPARGIRGGWKKKKRGPGRPRKSQLSETPDSSELDSLFDEMDREDLENEPVVMTAAAVAAAAAKKEEEENIPTVELDLFTLNSTNEQVSVLLTEPKNPNFKVYASMDAIFVGDSALGDVTNQIGYVTDANNVVYVNPSHFLFPNVEDLENFVPSPILTMKGNKVGLTPVRKSWSLGGNKSYTPIVLKQVGVKDSKDSTTTDTNLDKKPEGIESSVPQVMKSRVEEHLLKVKATPSTNKVLVKKAVKKVIHKPPDTSTPKTELPDVIEPELTPTEMLPPNTKGRKRNSHKKKRRRRSGSDKESENSTSGYEGSNTVSVSSKGIAQFKAQHTANLKDKERQAVHDSLIQKCVVKLEELKYPIKFDQSTTLSSTVPKSNVETVKSSEDTSASEFIDTLLTDSSVEESLLTSATARDSVFTDDTADDSLLGNMTGDGSVFINTTAEESLLANATAEKSLLTSTRVEESLLTSTAEESQLTSTAAEESMLTSMTAEESQLINTTAEESVFTNVTAEESQLTSTTAADLSVSINMSSEESQLINTTAEESLLTSMTAQESVLTSTAAEEGVLTTTTTTTTAAAEEEDPLALSTGVEEEDPLAISTNSEQDPLAISTASEEDPLALSNAASEQDPLAISTASEEDPLTTNTAEEDLLTTNTAEEEDPLPTNTAEEDVLTTPAGEEELLTTTAAEEDLLPTNTAEVDLLTSTTAAEDLLTNTAEEDPLPTNTAEEGLLTTTTVTQEDLLTTNTAEEDLLTTPTVTEEALLTTTTTAEEENLLTTIAVEDLLTTTTAVEASVLTSVSTEESQGQEDTGIDSAVCGASDTKSVSESVAQPNSTPNMIQEMIENTIENTIENIIEQNILIEEPLLSVEESTLLQPIVPESCDLSPPVSELSKVLSRTAGGGLPRRMRRRRLRTKSANIVSSKSETIVHDIGGVGVSVSSGVSSDVSVSVSGERRVRHVSENSVLPDKAEMSEQKRVPVHNQSDSSESGHSPKRKLEKTSVASVDVETDSPKRRHKKTSVASIDIETDSPKRRHKKTSVASIDIETDSPKRRHKKASVASVDIETPLDITLTEPQTPQHDTYLPLNPVSDSNNTLTIPTPGRERKRARKHKTKHDGKEIKQESLSVEPWGTPDLSTGVCSEQSTESDQEEKQLVRSVRERRPSFKLLESLSVANQSPKRSTFKSEELCSPTDIPDSFVSRQVDENTITSPSSSVPDSSPSREWLGRGAKLKAQVLIQDQQAGVMDSHIFPPNDTHQHASDSTTPRLVVLSPARISSLMPSAKTPSPTSSSKSSKPVITVQNREWQARGAKLKAQVMISDPESSLLPYTNDELPVPITSPPSKKMKLDLSVSPANTKDIRSFFKSGKSVGEETASLRSPASPGSPLSPHSSRTAKRHPKNGGDIRKYFNVASPTTTTKKIKEENVRSSPKKLKSPTKASSDNTVVSSNGEDVKVLGESVLGDDAFEGFRRLTRQSGLRSKALLRLVSILNSKRWNRLNKFPLPVDQLCEWDDELLSEYDFD